MPENQENQVQEQSPTTLVFWLKWLASQGVAVIVLIGVSVALGYYLYKIIPENDARWAKALAEQRADFMKELDARDARFIEYRTKADERFAKALTDILTTQKDLMAQKDKDIDRVVNLLTSRINDVKTHAEATAKKVDGLMN